MNITLPAAEYLTGSHPSSSSRVARNIARNRQGILRDWGLIEANQPYRVESYADTLARVLRVGVPHLSPTALRMFPKRYPVPQRR